MPKRTYQPKIKKAKRKQGFRNRARRVSGKRILKRRRKKGRARLVG